MSVILKGIWQGYGYLVEDAADPLSKDWFLVSSPLVIAAILVCYNYFCTIIGPSLMKNRKPFAIQNVLKAYNLFHITLSTYIFYEGTVLMFFNDFNFFCQNVHSPCDPNALRIVSAVWWYYIAKLTELFDTVFFVLRKSNRQISFLHLYHHTAMALAAWIAVKFFPDMVYAPMQETFARNKNVKFYSAFLVAGIFIGIARTLFPMSFYRIRVTNERAHSPPDGGQSIFVGWINSFIHIVMYTYYFISGLGPNYKKYLWWKRYLTIMQIVQFALISFQNIISLFFDCGYPTVIKMLIIAGTSAFTWMFSSFYYYNYIKTNRNRTKENNPITSSDMKIS